MMKEAANHPHFAWPTVGVAGAVLPVLAMLWLAPAVLAPVSGTIVAIGLMGIGMIAAAAAGRLWVGVLLALIAGVGLILLARMLGLPALPHPFSTGLAVIIASISFAVRGALFARAYPGTGWLLAVLVVTGEAAMLITATALPAWLPALLPAQWASTAIQTALTGSGTRAASSALFALAGTAATTLIVVGLWPRRWPYLLMFTAWLALSALVWHRPGPPRADLFSAFAPAAQAPTKGSN